MWLIGVPLTFIGSMLLKFDITQVVLLISLEEVVKFIVCFKRLISYK